MPKVDIHIIAGGDEIMENQCAVSVKEIAGLVGGSVQGDPEVLIQGLQPIDAAGEGDITFLADKKYLAALPECGASAIICTPEVEVDGKTLIHTDNPYLAFAKVMQKFHPRKREAIGVHQNATVSETAQIGKNTNIYAGAFVGNNAVIGDGVDVMPGCYVGNDVQIGSDTLLYSNVSVYDQCEIGERVIIHSHTVIGSDGFGFATDKTTGIHCKIPQVGNVIIENDVEIGSNTSIDRGALGSTRIGEGTKVDNLVQIAHNVQIGKHCFVVAQVGISGSSKVGNNCILAGQVGVVGHVEIGDRCVVAAQAGVSNSVPEGSTYWGSPARPIGEMKRIIAVQSKLPKLKAKVRELEKRIKDLEEGDLNKEQQC